MASHSALPFKVECNMGAFWEAIAAFNCVDPAERYAQDCADGAAARGLPYEYRVKSRGRVVEIEPRKAAA